MSSGTTSTTRRKAVTGAVLLLALLVLGALALTPQVTHGDLSIDQAVTPLRFHAATTVFLGLTDAAQEVVGLAALAIGVVVLFLRHRRWDAARLFVMAGAAWTLALAIKYVYNRPRPPASLWLLKPDATGSFPSGHDTTATVIVLVVVMIFVGTGRLRVVATALSVLFTLGVGASRVYLGDHYPTDVLGSYLTVGAAVLLVWALTDLTRVRRLGARLLRVPDLAAVPPTGQQNPNNDQAAGNAAVNPRSDTTSCEHL